MVEEIIEGEVIEASPLAVRDEPQAPALFGTSDPVEVISKAVRVADALKAVVVSKKLISVIQGKEYPLVEAWLTLAAMLRLTTVCEWSRRVPDGWEARVFIRDASGAIVGAAEAQCLGSERSKKSWEDYALRSMAQTRATSKALRSVLGFIMVLAGYQATPAEEMPSDPTPPRAMLHPQTQSNDKQRAYAFFLCKRLNFEDHERHAFFESVAGYDAEGQPIRSWAAVVSANKASKVIDALKAEVDKMITAGILE